MVFTVLGGDNTGGIIWHPSVLAAASEYGMYLSKDNMLIAQERVNQRPIRRAADAAVRAIYCQSA